MVTTRVIKGISFKPDVFEALETLRGNSSHFRSEFIDTVLREKLGLKK